MGIAVNAKETPFFVSSAFHLEYKRENFFSKLAGKAFAGGFCFYHNIMQSVFLLNFKLVYNRKPTVLLTKPIYKKSRHMQII